MSSRKRKQAKSRQAKASQATANVNVTASCPHRDLTKNWAADEYAACEELLSKMKTTVSSFLQDNTEMENPLMKLLGKVVWLWETGPRYQFKRKPILREMVLAEGTEVVRSIANKTDLTKEESIYEALPFVFLLTNIEVSEKYEWWHGYEDYVHEVTSSVSDIIMCPRNIVRFFHRRNECDCLKTIYYKLKDETERTALCDRTGCNVVKGIKGMIQCEQCRLRWCSKSCCIAMQRYHERYCKSIKEAEIKKKRTLNVFLKDTVIWALKIPATFYILRFVCISMLRWVGPVQEEFVGATIAALLFVYVIRSTFWV